MKKLQIMITVVMAFLMVSTAWAAIETTTIITRDVIIKGDAVRGPLVTGLVNSYFPDTKGKVIEDGTLGEYVTVSGPGGTEKIHFSPKLVERLKKLSANPRAGEGLMNICPSQSKSLVKAIGPMRATMEPLIETEKVSICDKKGGCYEGRILTGSYQTLRPYNNGIRMVSNSGNHKYPENSISFKVEYHKSSHIGWTHGTNWGPTIVLRNITMENPLQLADVNASLILPYLEHISALKKGQSGNDGDSCWEVVILRDGTLYKDESPAEAPFRR